MDERYFIYGGIALLLLALVVYLLDSIARYRRALRKAGQTAAAPDSEGEAKYLTDQDHASEAFSAPAPCDAPEPDAMVDQSSAAGRVADLYDTLLAEVGTPPSSMMTVEPITTSGPARDVAFVEREPDDMIELEEPIRAVGVAGIAASTAAGDEWAGLMEAIGTIEEPAGSEILLEVVPEEKPVVTAGYSLADELERLMSAAESQSVLLPQEVHEDTAPVVQSTPQPVFEAPPLLPPLSVGQALSVPEERPTSAPIPVSSEPVFSVQPEMQPVPEPVPEPAPEPVPSPEPEPTPEPARGLVPAQAAALTPQPEPTYALVAPVEIHFTGGGGRVGVRPGTRSYAEFQRLAGIMLSDLRAARGR